MKINEADSRTTTAFLKVDGIFEESEGGLVCQYTSLWDILYKGWRRRECASDRNRIRSLHRIHIKCLK
jgi:hypothetical protein